MSNRGWLLIFLDIWVNFYVIAKILVGILHFSFRKACVKNTIMGTPKKLV
jgi:hypothetical protein